MAQIVNIKGTTRHAKIRHPAIAFALVFATLGIYYPVWYYKVNRELRDLGRAVGDEQQLGRSPLTSWRDHFGWLIVVPPFVSFYGTSRRIAAAQDVSRTTRRSTAGSGSRLYIVGAFTLPVEIIYAQSELNQVWRGDERMSPPADAVA